MALTGVRVTRQRLIDSALRMVEQDGINQLSMRKLAAELGVAVTAIYWHVGNRDALIDALVERELADMGAIRATGATAEVRLVSIARALHAKLLARPHLIGLVNERGLTSRMFLPAQVALARELSAAGLRGRSAAMAVRAIQFHVIGSVVLQRWSERSPAQQPTAEELWRQNAVEAGVDATVAGHLAESLDPAQVFEFSTRTLVKSLLSNPGES
jgi:AcrR family transcriptional regulator